MSRTIFSKSVLLTGIFLFSGFAMTPVNVHAVEISASSSATVNAVDRTKIVDRANREIDRRIKNLTALGARISEAKKISADAKASFKGTIQAEITSLTGLKAKIAVDTDSVTLKADVQSITKSYRIYALIMPQIAILAHADRVLTIADAMTVLAAKLQTRIAEAQSAGQNITLAQAKLSDLNEKIGDARAEAQASMALVTSLTPDNGDRTKMQSNTQALQDARAKLRVAQTDLEKARKDARDIVKIVKDFRVTASSTMQTSTTIGQ